MRESRRPKPLYLIEKRKELLETFKEDLPEKSLKKARKDSLTKRSPRWCGITIHVTINCPFACAYCYIESMGFSFSDPKPYPLTGKELVFALLNNPAFFPTRYGTLLAMGAVSEPLIFMNKFLEYVESLSELGNPIQFSTKQFISSHLARKLRNIVENKNISLSPLITVITINKADTLEKRAPKPEKRFDSMKNLADEGFKPILFLRPIIPGINDMEINTIIKKAKDSGAIGVVVGGFRATKSILIKLDSLRLDTSEVRRRVKIIKEKQISVPFPEKAKILNSARDIGIIPWATACCANSYTAKIPCPSVCFIDGPCTKCPNNCDYKRDSADVTELRKALGILNIDAKIRDRTIVIKSRPFRGTDFAVRVLSRRKVINYRKK